MRPPAAHARATDTYTLRGGGVEEWEPRFTFHGFRYAEVDGWPGELEPGAITAVVCHTDMERTGWFACSDPLLDRLHENVVWGMRGNFLDVPTDCPQRDERLGWTGDAQVFAPTASFLYDCAGMLASWLRDLAAEQTPGRRRAACTCRSSSSTSRRRRRRARRARRPVAAWGDAAVIVPWVLYERFGDAELLADAVRQHARLGRRAWPRARATRLLWDEGFQLGDWLDPTAPPDEPWRAATDAHLVATAYLARSAELLARAADVLGRDGRRRRATARSPTASGGAFNREYVTPTGRIASDSQTGYALALEFALLPDAEQRERAGRAARRARRAAPATASPPGFVGTPLICDALSARRRARHGLPAAAAARVPVVAVLGDDGRHHGVGALGQHAARRHASTPAR